MSFVQKKKKSGVPDRWLDYCPVGQKIPGTRFIAFKVPLKPSLNSLVPESDSFGLWDLLDRLESQNQELGLIIDLTFTTRYYALTDVPQSCSYIKIFTEGHHVPSDAAILSFKRAVRHFLKDNQDNNKLIGVHCTHGLNRTGYLVCRYLIDVDGLDPKVAVELFNSSRGHPMERKNYLRDLQGGAKRSNHGIDEPENEATRGLAAERPPQTAGQGGRPTTIKTSGQEGQPMKTSGQEGQRMKTSGQEGQRMKTSGQGGRPTPIKTSGEEGRPMKTSGQEGQRMKTSGQEGQRKKTSGQEGQRMKTSGQEGQRMKTSGQEGQRMKTSGQEGQRMKTSGQEGQRMKTSVQEGQQMKTSGQGGRPPPIKTSGEEGRPMKTSGQEGRQRKTSGQEGQRSVSNHRDGECPPGDVPPETGQSDEKQPPGSRRRRRPRRPRKADHASSDRPPQDDVPSAPEAPPTNLPPNEP